MDSRKDVASGSAAGETRVQLCAFCLRKPYLKVQPEQSGDTAGGVNGAPVYSNTNSFLFNNSINTNNPLYLNTGNEIRLFNNSSVIYGHLMDNSPSTTALKALVQTFQQSHIWRAFLPAGTKIGNVGNTGNVYGQIGPDFGAHLHWEWRKGYQFWSNRSVQ